MRKHLAVLVALAAVTSCGGPGGAGSTLGPDPAQAATPVVAPATQPTPAAQPAPPPVAGPVVTRKQVGAVVLEGTPEIPDALRARLNRYLNTRSAGIADLADDGKSMLVSTRFGRTSQIHRVARPLGARTQLTFRDEPVRTAQFVPGGAGAVVYVADVGGNEQHQIYRMKPGGGVLRLTDGKSRNGSVLWSRDGKQLAYSSNTRNKRDFDVWVSSGKDPKTARRLVDAKGWFYPIEFTRDGKKLLVGHYISVNESRMYLVDIASGAKIAISPDDKKAAYGGGVFSKDGKRIYITTDMDGEFTELYEFSLATKSWRRLTRDIPWDVEALALSPAGTTLVFSTNEGGVSVLHTLSTRTRKHRRIKGVPQGIVGGLQYADKADVVGFSLVRPTSSGDAYTYNVKRKKLTRWTNSELGGLDSKKLIEPRLIQFKTFDGAKIPAFYYAPKGKGPFPVVINIHGGPEGQSRPWFSPFTQYMLSQGIAIIYPNVRGSKGYGKSYLRLDNGFKREDSVKDIGALLDWIAAQPTLDAKRVGVTGGSYGGYMVLASLMHYSKRIVAGVDVVGISNFVTFLEHTKAYRRDLRRVEYGDERDPKMRAHLKKISPANHADKITSALFVVQGANDPRVPASEAEQVVAAVRKTGREVWYMLAKNEGHGFRKKENRDMYMQLMVMFLQKHLVLQKHMRGTP